VNVAGNREGGREGEVFGERGREWSWVALLNSLTSTSAASSRQGMEEGEEEEN